MSRFFCVTMMLIAGTAFTKQPPNNADMKVSSSGLWAIFGSFGKICGDAAVVPDGYRLEESGCRIETTVETDKGVSLRKTVLKNVSDKTITAYCLMDRFPIEDGEWEVYTQVNYWENESQGQWQPLHTAVEVRNPNLRSSHGAAPMLAVWNRQAGRGRVFHLLSDSAWELHAVCSNPGGNRTSFAVEAGMDSRQLAYSLAPGEHVALPEVLSYEFENRLDLDCHKLHAWWNRHHPGRPPAAIYNTWLCRFDKLDADFLLKQVARAKDLGMEYFVIDAGWFGPAAGWASVRGEWAERPDGHLKGRMKEISAAARKADLKFGFWVEAESVTGETRVAREHPEWLLPANRSFLDFTNPDARRYITETVCALVKEYDASFLKFDFNQNLDHDPTGRAFAAYNAAYRAFVRDMRRRNPGIYIEGCASGGYMMDLGWARDFDGFWLSDNQSIGHGLRIVRETMLRFPPRQIERWLTVRSLTDIQPDYGGGDERLVSTEDAVWRNLRSYPLESAAAFTAGGPLCFSCDLTALSENHFAYFQKLVAAHRQDAAFWARAVGRVLCAESSVQAVQYSDEALTDVRIFVTADSSTQRTVTVTPVVDPSARYVRDDGHESTGAVLRASGVSVALDRLAAKEIRLRKCMGSSVTSVKK